MPPLGSLAAYATDFAQRQLTGVEKPLPGPRFRCPGSRMSVLTDCSHLEGQEDLISPGGQQSEKGVSPGIRKSPALGEAFSNAIFYCRMRGACVFLKQVNSSSAESRACDVFDAPDITCQRHNIRVVLDDLDRGGQVDIVGDQSQ